MRALTLSVVLACSGLLSTGCYTSHEVDEGRIEPLENRGPRGPGHEQDAGTTPQVPEDAGEPADACADITDPIQRVLCSLGGGGAGGLQDLIDGLLGGGNNAMDCSKETDPIARLLCTITSGGGTGLEGLLGELLGGGGGGLLGDAGLSGVITDVFVDVIRGVIDDLIQGLLGSFQSGLGSGEGNPFGGGLFSARLHAEHFDPAALPAPSEEECAAVSPESRLTRLLCVRRALDVLEAQLPAEAN